MYETLYRLRDYEKTVLNPGDFRSDSYENKYMCKVFYKPASVAEFQGILCETKENADAVADILKKAGSKNVLANQWSWQELIEEQR